MNDKRPSSETLRDRCFHYWKIETGDGRIMLPCKGKTCNGALFNTAIKGFHADHRIPRALGGSDFPPNLQPLCHSCHQDKTAKEDVPRIAKSKRQTRRVHGITRSEGTGWNKKWKRKISGEVVER
jgi:hypothetical protein